MKASEKTWNTFYQRLGYLFYSIAASDKRVVAEEVDELHRMVLEDWVSPQGGIHDVFGTDSAFQIEIIFDYVREKELDSEKAFHLFEEFFKENIGLFTDDVIRKIYHTSDRIATSFHARNKSELTALTRLHFLLGKENHVF